MEFLTETNIAGQTLLRLVSRGSSIIAELQRLVPFTPTAVLVAGLVEEDKAAASAVIERDPRAARFRGVLWDFRYLKTPDMFERELNRNSTLSDLSDEFLGAHADVLSRFYALFESIHTYVRDYATYLRELEEGFYIQHTLEAVLLDTDGRQLLCEALYLQGVMLLLLDAKVPGCVRERLVIAHYRSKGEGAVPIADVAKLCRDTGYRAPAIAPAAKRPANYPEEYLARFPLPAKVRRGVGGGVGRHRRARAQ
jgi:WASH complex subunit strumpellin